MHKKRTFKLKKISCVKFFVFTAYYSLVDNNFQTESRLSAENRKKLIKIR